MANGPLIYCRLERLSHCSRSLSLSPSLSLSLSRLGWAGTATPLKYNIVFIFYCCFVSLFLFACVVFDWCLGSRFGAPPLERGLECLLWGSPCYGLRATLGLKLLILFSNDSQRIICCLKPRFVDANCNTSSNVNRNGCCTLTIGQ